jgi:predicted glycogen debranching enzyme
VGVNPDPVRVLRWSKPDDLLEREWLVTNGLGGYAFGTVAGTPIRGYHAALIAARPPPLGRQILLAHLGQRVQFGTSEFDLAPLELSSRSPTLPTLEGEGALDFRLELGLPIWRHRFASTTAIERRVCCPHGSNAVIWRYESLDASSVCTLVLRPYFHVRPQDSSVGSPLAAVDSCSASERELLVRMAGQGVRLALQGGRARWNAEALSLADVRYREELVRGYPGEGPLWSPGEWTVELEPNDAPVHLFVAEESEVTPNDLAAAMESERKRRRALIAAAPEPLRTSTAAELLLAADAFLVKPAYRQTSATSQTIIAGYPWFTDWGRDTMISLEGLTLLSGRASLAREILLAFAAHVRDGLVPNLFPEGSSDGLYNTADATLWFFHAASRYFELTGDRDVIRALLPTFIDVIWRHHAGTRFGIGVDPSDGLLRQGEAGYQLTWMDAKVGDRVITPRRGKAVEINALWYQALRLMQEWCAGEGSSLASSRYRAMAERVQRTFNERFWNAERSMLFDVVDAEGGGNDDACRPNQLLAISLPHPVLDPSRRSAVFEAVRSRLETPFGLRSLEPGRADYRGRYFGDLVSRDEAYHQGTVWAFWIGPLTDAHLALFPSDREGARARLAPPLEHLGDAGVGSVSEIFDGDAPFAPRGTPAQAWSVAELLRALWLTRPDSG